LRSLIAFFSRRARLCAANDGQSVSNVCSVT
jgi:hypothetical protein